MGLCLTRSALPSALALARLILLSCLRGLSVLEEASASQASSKKEGRADQAGKNRTYDIRIENFDVSFGER